MTVVNKKILIVRNSNQDFYLLLSKLNIIYPYVYKYAYFISLEIKG
jgi:hypothetical protein